MTKIYVRLRNKNYSWPKHDECTQFIYECKKYQKSSDGPGLGLSPKPARPRRFLGGPSPPEARSSKPESPAGFFGPKIGQFSAKFLLNLGKNYGIFCNKIFHTFCGLFCGLIWAENRPTFDSDSGKIMEQKFFKNFSLSFFLKNRCIECFEKARNRPEARYKKARPARGPIHKSPSPPEARKTQARNITKQQQCKYKN